MFNVGDKIVYPMHGAGTIDSIEEKDILGEKQAYYIIKMPGEVKVMVPTVKAEEIGVRNIISKENERKKQNVVATNSKRGGGVYDRNDFITYYKITFSCTMCRNYYHICLNYSIS